MARADEPADFDTKVRQKGLVYLAGQTTLTKKADKPYWQACLPEMKERYDNTCAYLGIRIFPAIGFATVDHFVPRDAEIDLAYEWSNFRLAAHPVNTLKRTTTVPIDPFLVVQGEFHLNFVDGTVEVGDTDRAVDVQQTITGLRLNDDRFVTSRLEYIDAYLSGGMNRELLARWFPFGDSELTRQEL